MSSITPRLSFGTVRRVYSNLITLLTVHAAVGEAFVTSYHESVTFSLLGRGDSVASVYEFGLASGVSYVSAGGGPLLDAVQGDILPGIAAIND
jgi:3-phosphoglycerate kinase